MSFARATSILQFLQLRVDRTLDAVRDRFSIGPEDSGDPDPSSGSGSPGRGFWKTVTVLIVLSALTSESLTPNSFAHGLLYLLSVLAAGMSLDRNVVILAVISGLCGILMGFVLSAEIADPFWFAAEQLLSTVALIATGIVTHFLLGHQSASRRLGLILRKADQVLVGSERRLKNAEAIGESGSWEIHPERDRVVVSENFLTLFGIDPDADLQSIRKLLALMPNPDRAKLIRSIRSAFVEHRSVDEVHGLLRADGEVRQVRTMISLLPKEGGFVISGVTRDVTDRLAAERKMNEDEVHQRFAGKIGRIGGWHYDRTADNFIPSEQAARALSIPTNTTATLKEVFSHLAPSCRLGLKESLNGCLDHCRPFDVVVEIRQPHPRWLRVSGEPFEDKGKVVGARGALQDVTDLIIAQNASRETAARLQRTLDQMSDGFFLLDRNWRFSFVNRRAIDWLGAQSTELLGKVVWEALPSVIGTDFEAKYREAMETGKPVRFTSFFPPLRKWFLIEAEPTLEGLAVFAQDVTQRRADEAQLRLLSAAMARLNDMIVISEVHVNSVGDAPRIVYANAAFERQTGFRMDEVQGKGPFDYFDEQVETGELSCIAARLDRGASCRAELNYHRKTGEGGVAEVEFVPLMDGTTATHWIAVGRDVSERKKFLDELRLSEERFRLVTRATNDVIYDWNLEENKIWFSENIQGLLGQVPSVPEDNRSPFFLWLDPEDRERVEESLLSLASGDQTVISLEYRLCHPEKGILRMQDDAFAFRGQDGRATRIIGSLKDMTFLHAQQEQLKEAQKLEATGRLTGGIAHDFNNLLTIVIGTTELIGDYAEENPELKRLTDTVITAAERGAALTHHLLAFARRQPLAPQLVEIESLIEGMQPLFLRALTESVALDIEVDRDTWPITVDKNQLENALLNLVINARHAMPRGGHLKVEVGNRTLEAEYVAMHPDVEPGAYVMIALSDDGEGMSPDVVERAFEPFFTTKPTGEGSGMGLSMVYGFIKQSRGHIAIYSELGEGTVVRLYLPRSGEAAPEAEDGEPQAEETAKGEHILVVEDDQQLQKNVAEQLTALGYRLTLASNAREALAALQTPHDITLLFTDIVMPGGMNGRELAEHARTLKADLKVVYTSGYTQDARVQQGRAEANIHFLSKPYRRRDLARVIREALDEEKFA